MISILGEELTLLRMAVDPLVSSFEHDGQMDGTSPFDDDDDGGFGRGVKLTVISFFRLNKERRGRCQCSRARPGR